MSWEEILEESIKNDRSKDLLLSNVYTREVVTHDMSSDSEEISSQEYGYFYELNTILDKTFDKDILVYVHGANCNFYRATSQGAQFYHFTGHNTIVLTFSWPSAENLFKYKTDVLHAKKTVPAFAKLIELLATNSKARNINILAYSAGAQVAAPGLAYLRDLYPDESTESLRKRLRIGEVYFAAPDTAFKPFIERYLKFKDIVRRTTINLNRNDSVLRLSAMQNGVSRLGRPDGTELDENERQAMINEINTPYLNVLDVGDSAPLNIGKAHDSWYNHPWVSMDVLLLLLLNLDPLERGLEEFWHDGKAKTYRFPDNYDIKLRKFAKENRAMIEEKVKIKHGQ
jgi:esterase/lipase superfamily enzyme